MIILRIRDNIILIKKFFIKILYMKKKFEIGGSIVYIKNF
jgi:hypothetical protein